MLAAPDGILETLTVVVINGLVVQQPRTQGSLCAGPGTRLDVQQDVLYIGLCSCCEYRRKQFVR
jgi:hypothetical protein